jgi:hypothetical protein
VNESLAEVDTMMHRLIMAALGVLVLLPGGFEFFFLCVSLRLGVSAVNFDVSDLTSVHRRDAEAQRHAEVGTDALRYRGKH